MQALSQYELWFVTGSQELYGAEVLGAVGEDARAIARGLSESAAIPVRVVAGPVLTSADAIRALCLDANAAPQCIGIVAWMHTFSPAKMWIGGLMALQKPLLHLHTQFNRELPWSSIDMDFMNLNQSAHGDREFGYIQTRLRLARTTVVGHWQDAAVLERVGVWARAAAGWHEAQHLRVLRFGDNMRDVAVTEGDKIEAQRRLGFSVNTYGPSELAAAAGDASEAAVSATLEQYDDAYDMAPELRPDGARRESLREAARIEVGLRGLLTGHGALAFTDTFEDLAGLRQLPGIAVQRLMAEGYGFGAEGDWKSAALVRITKAMSEGLPGGTSFMEDYTYDFGSGASSVLGAHMLEVCPSIAAGRPRCEIHPLAIGNRDDPVRLVFDAAPGPAVVTGLLDLGNRFRLVCNVVDTVAAPQPLPKLPVARAVWQPRPSLEVAAEAWLLSGGPHHTSYSQALRTEHLEAFAEIAGIELVVIDAETTVRELARELRSNQAYYMLAAGL